MNGFCKQFVTQISDQETLQIEIADTERFWGTGYTQVINVDRAPYDRRTGEAMDEYALRQHIRTSTQRNDDLFKQAFKKAQVQAQAELQVTGQALAPPLV